MFDLFFHRKMPIPRATIPQAIEIEVKESWFLNEKTSTNKYERREIERNALTKARRIDEKGPINLVEEG